MCEKWNDELRKILLAPIIVDRELNKSEKGLVFKWSDDSKKTIISGQKYKRDPDADMSDIAVAFYESLYEINMLKEDGHLVDDDFAGDTINTPKIVGRSCVNDKPEELNKLIKCPQCQGLNKKERA